MTLFFLKKNNTLIKKYKNIIKCVNIFLIFFLVNPSIILFYFILFWHIWHLNFTFYFIFSSLFISFTRFFPIPIKYLFSFPPLTILSLTHLKDSFSSFTQKTRRERYITHTHTHTKERRRIHSKRRRRRRSQQWVYVGIENCTLDLEFCSLFGWLEFGGKEKKEEPVWGFVFWASCNWRRV